MSDDLRIFRRDRVVGQALRASLVSGNTTRPIRIDQNMPNQTVTFIRTAYQFAVERQRIADACAERQYREAIQSNAGPKHAGINDQRIDIVVNARRQSSSLANHSGELHGLRPVHERCERHHGTVDNMPAKRDSHSARFRPARHLRLVGTVGRQLFDQRDHGLRGSVFDFQIMTSGDDLPDCVDRNCRNMRRVDFHANERSRIRNHLQSGLRAAATFRIFFLHETFRQFAGLAGRHRRLLNHARINQIAGNSGNSTLRKS